VLTGIYLLECTDLDHAIATATRIPATWNGAVEVRPLVPLAAQWRLDERAGYSTISAACSGTDQSTSAV